jgi:DNA-binding SARP family transcriptional activator/tetratricopeptide (TPR) repeat protein
MYQLRCLGEATLRNPTGQLIHFRSCKHFALLVYLALNTDRAHRRERLAGLLWSDSDESKARHSLSQALYAVRRLLNGAVQIEGEDLQLRPDGLYVDALELERCLRSGDAAAAASIYRGDFLEGFRIRGAQGFEEWAGREHARVSAMARDALRQATKAARDRCDWVEVSQQAQRLVDLDPFDEAAYSELMRALWMQGDRTAAFDRYEELKRVLAADLQARPSQETEALAERIRQRPVRGGWSTHRLLRESQTTLLHDPPFVGRKPELTALSEEWDRLITGETRTVALVGAAGIGKTRLADEFINSLVLNDVTILRGCCYEAEQTLPYGPVAEALRQGIESIDLSEVNPLWLAELARIVPEVCEKYGDLPEPAVLDAEGSRRRLYEGIARVLRSACETRPVLLFVDDLHWADDSSLALLHYLHRRVSNGLYLLTAHRPEDLEAGEGATATGWLSGENGGVRTIHVEGLDRSAGSDLVSTIMGRDSDSCALTSVREMSGGNPFFAIELARSLTEDEEGEATESARPAVPESIRALLEKRFSHLAERSVAVVQQAACLGTRFSYEALLAAVGLAPLELEGILRELSRARTLSVEDGIIRFRHDLIREVAWSRVPAALHSALHLRSARALIKTDGSDGEIAGHLSASGGGRGAHAYALRGAQRAEGVFALEEAADLLALAIRHAPNESTRMNLVGRLGKLYLHMRDYTKARPLLEGRLEHVRCGGHSLLEVFEARRDVLFVDVYSSAIKVAESGQALKAFYVELKGSGLDAPELEANVLGKLFWAAARSFNPELAEETIGIIRELHSRTSQAEVRWRTARSLGIYERYKGRLDVAEDLLTEALSLAQELGDEAAVLDCYIGLTTLLPRIIRAELAEHILAVALPLAEQRADPAHITALLCNCAACYMYMCDADRAEPLLSRARQVLLTSGDYPDTSPSVLFNLGYIASLRGDHDTSQNHWTRAIEVSEEGGVLPVLQETLVALGKLALRRGDVSQARSLAARAVRLARKGSFLVDERCGLEDLLARLRFQSGRGTKALRELAVTAAHAKGSDVPLFLTAQLARLEFLVDKQMHDKAREIKSELCEVARSLGAFWWVEQAERLYNLG